MSNGKISFSLFSLCSACLLCISSGCTSASLKMEPTYTYVQPQKMPVMLNLTNIRWSSSATLPTWINSQRLTQLISNIESRDSSLFSSDEKALPIKFQIDETRISDTNAGLIFLGLLSGFVLPTPTANILDCNITLSVGEDENYKTQSHIKIRERTFFSLVPFFAFLMPGQSNYFCHGFVDIGDNAIYTHEMQNVFLNMIYKLDQDKLRKIYDDKFGEDVQLIGGEE